MIVRGGVQVVFKLPRLVYKPGRECAGLSCDREHHRWLVTITVFHNLNANDTLQTFKGMKNTSKESSMVSRLANKNRELYRVPRTKWNVGNTECFVRSLVTLSLLRDDNERMEVNVDRRERV